VEDRLRFSLTETAVEYTRRQLLTRAGADPDTLPLSVHYGEFSTPSDGPRVTVQPCAPAAWGALLERTPNTLHWIPASEVVPSGANLPFDAPVPVLFWGAEFEDGNKPFAELHPDGTVVFYADIIATTFFMLSRWEETVIPARDEHERFPATASVACKQGFLDRPVVDEYALILREWLKALLPGWQPRQRPFSVKLSHDIDNIRRFQSVYRFLLVFGADLLKRRSLRCAWETGIEPIVQIVSPSRAAYLQGIQALAELSLDCGLGNDAFYFMATGPGPQESDHDLASPLVKQCIDDLRKQGFEIGLHPGYYTFNDPERLAAEKARLDAVLGQGQYGGRQHALRFQVPNTWRHWEQVGLTYDSTMGYADQEGFRCGTCHPFRPFDVEQNRELDLWEWPLVVMDCTLYKYRKLAPEQGEARMLELAQRCRQVEGTFTLLWHNSVLAGGFQHWAAAYRRVVRTLAEKMQREG
jgi:hypothetical protein